MSKDSERLLEAITRIERHEAMCEERTKTIFNRLSSIDDSIKGIENLIKVSGGTLIIGMAGLIVTLLLR
jgi:hypothetical protein